MSVRPSRYLLRNRLMDFDKEWYVSPFGHNDVQRHIWFTLGSRSKFMNIQLQTCNYLIHGHIYTLYFRTHLPQSQGHKGQRSKVLNF